MSSPISTAKNKTKSYLLTWEKGVASPKFPNLVSGREIHGLIGRILRGAGTRVTHALAFRDP